MPSLISSQQIAYVENRFIGDSGRLISDIMEIRSWFNITCFLLSMGIEKAFGSLNHIFLISVLKKFRFGKKKYHLDRNLIKEQQSNVS